MAGLPCTCEAICPDAPHCACAADAKTGKCILCDCGELVTEPPEILEADASINLCVRNKELGDLAEFIHRITDAEVLVPASDLRKPITIQLEDVTLTDGLNQLGLSLAPPPAGTY